MKKLSVDIIDLIFSFVNGTNYYYVNKLFYGIVKNKIKKNQIQICLDYLNNNYPYCPKLENLFENEEYNKNLFVNNSFDFVDISKKKHRDIYNYLFNDLPSNFYIAGGSILGILKWNIMDKTKFKLSDIDIYFIGDYNDAQMNIYNVIKKIKEIDKMFKIVETKHTISLYHPTFRKLQFILHVYNSLNELFSFFDFDIVRLAYNNHILLCPSETKKMLNFQTVTMDYDYINIFMEQLRCQKYYKKGFNILIKKQLPYYDIYMCHDIHQKKKEIKINDNKYCINENKKIKNIIQILKLTKTNDINPLNGLHKMHMELNNKNCMKINDFKNNIQYDLFNIFSRGILLNLKNYSIQRISYAHDKIEEELENDILDKSEHIESYNSFIYFDDVKYEDLPDNDLYLCDIITKNSFDITHLNMRYSINLCEKCGKYYYINDYSKHIC